MGLDGANLFFFLQAGYNFSKHKPCIERFYNPFAHICMYNQFFLLFLFDRWSTGRIKGPGVSWGIVFAQVKPQPCRNFMTCHGRASLDPPQWRVPCLSLNHQPSYDSQLLYLAGRDSGHSWANQPTNQPYWEVCLHLITTS